MTCILYIFLALGAPMVLSLSLENRNPKSHKPSQSRLKSGAELTSLSKIAEDISKLKQGGQGPRIDLDYYDGGFDRYHTIPDIKKENHLDLDQSRSNSLYPHKPRIVEVSNPEVLKDYQNNLKKSKRRGSSLGSHELNSLSIKDILEFLYQVEARLQEREAQAVNKLPISFSHLDDILENLRRRNEDRFDTEEVFDETDSYQRDSQRSTKRIKTREYSSQEKVRTSKRNSGKKTERHITEAPNKYDEEINESRSKEQLKIRKEKSQAPIKKKFKEKTEDIMSPKHVRQNKKNWKNIERSIERDFVEPNKYLPKNNFNRVRARVTNRIPSFMMTSIPMVGKRGIYEEE